MTNETYSTFIGYHAECGGAIYDHRYEQITSAGPDYQEVMLCHRCGMENPKRAFAAILTTFAPPR